MYDRYSELHCHTWSSFLDGVSPADELVELSIPRFVREQFDRVADVVPLYLRKSDAEIAWDNRARTG